jgi:tyrosine aminotransferase
MTRSIETETAKTAWTPLPASIVSQRTVNPIRRIVDNLQVKPNPDKPVISLALGDPTVFGNLSTDETCLEAIRQALVDHRSHGYAPSTGNLCLTLLIMYQILILL